MWKAHKQNDDLLYASQASKWVIVISTIITLDKSMIKSYNNNLSAFITYKQSKIQEKGILFKHKKL